MKKDDILESALDEFATYNYNRASINSIIKNSNTSKGTFYHYFESKEMLYFELVELAMKKKIKYLKESKFKIDENKKQSIFEIISNQMHNSINFGLNNPKYAKFVVKVANETNIEIKKKTQRVIEASSDDYLKKLIRNEISDGKIRDDLPEDFIYAMFSFMMTHFNDFLISGEIKIDIKNEDKIMNYIEYYMDFMKNGLSQ